MGKKAVIITYGCQMNVNDSAKIKNVLVDMGYEMIDEMHIVTGKQIGRAHV